VTHKSDPAESIVRDVLARSEQQAMIIASVVLGDKRRCFITSAPFIPLVASAWLIKMS